MCGADITIKNENAVYKCSAVKLLATMAAAITLAANI